MMETLNIPAKDWNAEKGKMEDTSLPEWQKYYADLKRHKEYMETKRPNPDHYPNEDSFAKAMHIWEMQLFFGAPNKPGYLFANNH